MPLTVVHAGQSALPPGLKKALIAVSQRTGIAVIADPEQERIYTARTKELIRSIPNSPRFEKIQIQNKDIWDVKISFDGKLVSVCGSRLISFFSLKDNGSLEPASSSAIFESDLVGFDWSLSDSSKYAVVTSDGRLHISQISQDKRLDFPINVTSCCWTLTSSDWLACGHRTGAVSIFSLSSGRILHAWPEVFPSPVLISVVIDPSVLMFAAHPADSDIAVKILKIIDPLSKSLFSPVDDWFCGSPKSKCRLHFARVPDWNIVFLSTSILTETAALRLTYDSADAARLIAATDNEDNPILLESVTNSVVIPATSLAVDFHIAQSTVGKFGKPAPVVLLPSTEGTIDFFYIMDTDRSVINVEEYTAGRAPLKDSNLGARDAADAFHLSTSISSTPKASFGGLFTTPSSVPASGPNHSLHPPSLSVRRAHSLSRSPGQPIRSIAAPWTKSSPKQEILRRVKVSYDEFVPQADLERAFLKGMQIIDDALHSCAQSSIFSTDIDVNSLLSETTSIHQRLHSLKDSIPKTSVCEIEEHLLSARGLYEIARAELNAHSQYAEERRHLPLDDALADFREQIRSSVADIEDNLNLLRIELDRRRLRQSQRPLQLLYSTINQNADTIARLQGELQGLTSAFDEVLAARRNLRPSLLKSSVESTDFVSKLEQFRSLLKDDLRRVRKKVPAVSTGEDDIWELSLDLDQIDNESIAIMQELAPEGKTLDNRPEFNFPQDDLAAIESIFSNIAESPGQEEEVESENPSLRSASTVKPSTAISDELSLARSPLFADAPFSMPNLVPEASHDNKPSFVFAPGSDRNEFASAIQTLPDDNSETSSSCSVLSEHEDREIAEDNESDSTATSEEATAEHDAAIAISESPSTALIDESRASPSKPAFSFPRDNSQENAPLFPTSSNAFTIRVGSSTVSDELSEVSQVKESKQTTLCPSVSAASPVPSTMSPLSSAFSFPRSPSHSSVPLFPTSSNAFSIRPGRSSLGATSADVTDKETAAAGNLDSPDSATATDNNPQFSPIENGTSVPLSPTSSNAFAINRPSLSVSDTSKKELSTGASLASSVQLTVSSPKDAAPSTDSHLALPSSPLSAPGVDETLLSSPLMLQKPSPPFSGDESSISVSCNNESTSGNGDSAAESTSQAAPSHIKASPISTPFSSPLQPQKPVDAIAPTQSGPNSQSPYVQVADASLFTSSPISRNSASENVFKVVSPASSSLFSSASQAQLQSSRGFAADSTGFASTPAFVPNGSPLTTDSDLGASSSSQSDAMDTRQSVDVSASLSSNWFGSSSSADSKPVVNPFGAGFSSEPSVSDSSGSLPKIDNPFANPPSNVSSFKSVFGQSGTFPVSNPFTSTTAPTTNPFAAKAPVSHSFGSSSISQSIPFSSAPGAGSTNNPFKSAGVTQPGFGQASVLGGSAFGGFPSSGSSGFGSSGFGSVSKPFGSAFPTASSPFGASSTSSNTGPFSSSGASNSAPFGSSSNMASFSSFGQQSSNSNPSASAGLGAFSFDTSSFRTRRDDD